MVVMVDGKTGASVLPHVEAEGELGAGSVITHLHNTVEKIVQISDLRPKQWNAALAPALVSVLLFFYSIYPCEFMFSIFSS